MTRSARILAWLLCLALLPLNALAQNDENLSGETFFDFAFRDEANIVMRGEMGGESKQENDESTMDEDGHPHPRLSFIDDDKSYRVSDLTLSCPLEYCQDKEHADALLRTTGLRIGHLTNKENLYIAIERLRKTEFFSNIHQHVEIDGPDWLKVHFDVVPHTVIRNLVVDESGHLYESQIRKRMILRPGSPLYPRTALLRGLDIDAIEKDKLIQMALEDQCNSLTRSFSKEGHFSIHFEIEPEEVGPYLVDLHIKAEHTHPYVLGQVYVRGHHIKQYAEIESKFRSGFSFLKKLTKAEIEDAIDGVLQMYRQDGYYQTKIDYVSRRNHDKRTIDVFLDIKESSRWEIQFSGNVALSIKELKSSLTFEESGYVDYAEIMTAAEALRQVYISAGYYWATVKGRMIRGTKDKNSVVLFTIVEGKRIEIGEIVFSGATAMTREELMKLIASREYSTFGSGAYPQRSMIADDAAKIIDAYRERGYLSADVPGWRLEPMEEGERLRLIFMIEEGAQSVFAHRQIRYLDRETYDLFNVEIDKPENNVFSDNAFRTERAAITKQLRARGHATIADRVRCISYTEDGRVSSEETCEIADFPPSCIPDDVQTLCTKENTDKGIIETCKRHYDRENNSPDGAPCVITDGVTGTEVDVEYEITLGPKYSFGDIFIHGNNLTRNWVVNQDVKFKPGETFDYNRIIDARSLLRRRTIYKSASLNVIGVDDGLEVKSEEDDSTSLTEREVPLIVNIEEGDRRWIDFALGLQLNNKSWIFTQEMEFVEANVLGTGWELRLLVMPEERLFNGSEFVFTQKFNQNFFTLLTLNIPVIPASGFNIITQLFYDLRYIPETNKEEYGWLVELQWNINSKLYSALAFELESSKTSIFGITVDSDISKYNVCYPVTFFQKCPFSKSDENEALTFSLTPRIVFDKRDNPLNPKSGIFTEAKLKIAYSDLIGFYLKPEARVSYVFSFLQNFSLAFNGRLGLSFSKSNVRLPLIDRYFLGGLNMRGYDNEALGPRLVNSVTPNVATNDAGGGDSLFNFSMELRFPIVTSIGIFGALFVDMGSLTAYTIVDRPFFEDMFAKQMRYSAGLGLRWLISESTPPIVIDYGFILNRRPGDPVGGFNLNVGYTF